MVESGNIISIFFSLHDDDGNELESNDGYAPLEYLHGANNIITGLENALAGLHAGDITEVVVKPADAYGEYDHELVYTWPTSECTVDVFHEGELVILENGKEYVVTKIESDLVSLDANHPLAGKTLFYRVKIAGIRKAREDELAFGFPLSHQSGCTGETGCC